MKIKIYGWMFLVNKIITNTPQAKVKIALTQNYDFCFSHYFAKCEPEVFNKTAALNYEKSQKLHGHSVKIAISVHCNDHFFSRDFMNEEVKKVLDPYQDKILNTYLDKVSCENLAEFLWKQLTPTPLGEYLKTLSIQETRKNRIIIQNT